MNHKLFQHESTMSAESTLSSALSEAQRWINQNKDEKIVTISHSVAFKDDGRCVALVAVWYR